MKHHVHWLVSATASAVQAFLAVWFLAVWLESRRPDALALVALFTFLALYFAFMILRQTRRRPSPSRSTP